MAGTVVIASALAQLAFWTLILLALAYGSLGRLGLTVFVVLWLAGYVGLPHVASWTWPLVTPWVAILDIALVFVVFGGDVRLT